MRGEKHSILLKVVLILCVLGIITAGYLVENHYAATESGSICDLGETVSCSIVNTSDYSEMFNVPVALFGALWFVILGVLAWKIPKEKHPEALISGFLAWNIVGMIFVFYLIYAEIVLGALCPFCTIVHIITLITFIISIVLYKGAKHASQKQLVNAAKVWITATIILFLIPIVLFNVVGEKEDYTAQAQCITEKGVAMYGSFRCGVCAKTRAMFGDAFEHINEIECHPQGENAQTDLCLEKDIEGTPTWILEENGAEVKRHTGFMSVEDLTDFAGCTADDIKRLQEVQE